MECKNYLNATWDVGKTLQYKSRNFVKHSKGLTKLLLKVNFEDCNLEGWNVVAYFKLPGFRFGINQAIPATGKIVDKVAIFDLEGDILSEFGKWSVEFTLKGPNGESLGSRSSGADVTYNVVEDVEGTTRY